VVAKGFPGKLPVRVGRERAAAEFGSSDKMWRVIRGRGDDRDVLVFSRLSGSSWGRDVDISMSSCKAHRI